MPPKTSDADFVRPLERAAPDGGETLDQSVPSVSSKQEIQTRLSFLETPDTPDCLGRLGSYRVLEVLGEGGMGIVLKAEEPQPRRLVALKIMRPEQITSLSRERFLREGQALAMVEHERVVPVYRVDEVRGVPFLVMPLLQGMSLRDWLTQDDRPPTDEVLRIGRETAEGLAAAHAAGLIHRDVKPSNIWLRGAERRVVLLDFGLARHAPSVDADATNLTGAGSMLGSMGYMSPEQAAGRAIDARTDLFSLGCVLYEVATGWRAFVGRDPLAVLSALANHEPPPLSDVRPDLPACGALVARLLAKSPARRPQSAAEVVAALNEIEQRGDDMASTITMPAAGASSASTGSRTVRLWIGCGALLAIAMAAAFYRTRAGTTLRVPWGDLRSSSSSDDLGRSRQESSLVPPTSAGALDAESSSIGGAPAPADFTVPLEVLSIDVQHYARLNDREAEPRGTLGKSTFSPRLGDQVTIEARLSRPAFAYLLAFRPDGEIEVCFPEDESRPPPLTDCPGYPARANLAAERYGLAEGIGLWVIAAVASERPLPAYRDFAAGQEAAWSAQSARWGTVWWYDGQWIEPLTDRAGGGLRAKGERALGASAAVVGAANWLKRAARGETVAAIGFAVAK